MEMQKKTQPVVKKWCYLCVLNCVAHIQLSRKQTKKNMSRIKYFWEDYNLFILKVNLWESLKRYQ